MWFNFWIQNSHFVIEIFFAFIMLVSVWIFLDSWAIKRETKIFFRSFGFIILTLWAFLDAALINLDKFEFLKEWLGVIGFGLILLSLIIDPVPVRPEGIKTSIKNLSIIIGVGFGSLISTTADIKNITFDFFRNFVEIIEIIVPFLKEGVIWQTIFLAIIVFLLHRHYARGLQIEWKFLFRGFLFIFFSSAITILFLWKNSENILIFKSLQDYGIVWIIEHILNFIGAFFIGIWTWGFIRFRIFPQLFISIIAFAFIIFVFTTIIYTGLLLKSVQDDAISNLEINAKIFDLSLRELKNEAILTAKIAAGKSNVREAIKKDEKEALFGALNNLMFENDVDFMAAVNKGGEVLMRAEDKNHFGDSLAEDPVVWRALDGKSVVTAFIEPGATVPQMTIRAASPIIDLSDEGNPEIIGATITGFIIDSAFVDGIKKLTGLDVAIFANDIRAATTFSVAEARLLGTRETDQRIIDKVLKKSEVFSGTALILNQPFYSAYVPLKDIENTTIGMVFTGRSQISILRSASDIIATTFGIAVFLMIVMVLPIYFLTRFITIQQNV